MCSHCIRTEFVQFYMCIYLLGPEKVAVEKGENGGAVDGKQRQAAAKATLKIAEGSPQGLDVQTINLADKDDDEEYSVEKEGFKSI